MFSVRLLALGHLWSFIDTQLDGWLGRLDKELFRFNWADALSLSLSLGVQKLTEYEVDGQKAIRLLEIVEQRTQKKLFTDREVS